VRLIYHITTLAEWQDALLKGFFEAASLKEEGFIHCSEEQQLDGVLERYYKGQANLVKLTIDCSRLIALLRVEWSASVKENFPHIYGSINTDAVITVDNL
jgi:uncharacterized protein (DUF952 family)